MLDDSAQQAEVTAPTVIGPGVQGQRDPAIFAGAGDQDIEDWLESYDRVSAHHWDDREKLNNVICYLSNVAHLWYRNHESGISSWSAFKTNFTDVFGRPAVRKLQAEQRLSGRAQQPGENFTSYIKDVVNLCNRVDAPMADADKIRHILKGREDDAFQMLVARKPTTVSVVIAPKFECSELSQDIRLQNSPPSQV